MHQLIAHQGDLLRCADGPRAARTGARRRCRPRSSPRRRIPPERPSRRSWPRRSRARRVPVRPAGRVAPGRPGRRVARTLCRGGPPADFGPFFWAQAQPGRPAPTLAELAQERGVQPGVGRVARTSSWAATSARRSASSTARRTSWPPCRSRLELRRCAGAARGREHRAASSRARWPCSAGCGVAALRAQPGAGGPLDGRLPGPAQRHRPGRPRFAETWWSVLLEQMWDGLL